MGSRRVPAAPADWLEQLDLLLLTVAKPRQVHQDGVRLHDLRYIDLTLAQDDFTDAEAGAAIGRGTGGNFRLIQRLFTQIERLLQINEMRTITKEVVEAARESMVIGPL